MLLVMMICMSIYLLLGLLSCNYGIAKACHHSKKNSDVLPEYISGNVASRKQVPSVLENFHDLETYYTDCLSRKLNYYSWKGIVHFVISETKWFQESNSLYCSNDDSSACWNYNTDFLVDQGSHEINNAVKECNILFSSGAHSASAVPRYRAKRQLDAGILLSLLLGSNQDAAGIPNPNYFNITRISSNPQIPTPPPPPAVLIPQWQGPNEFNNKFGVEDSQLWIEVNGSSQPTGPFNFGQQFGPQQPNSQAAGSYDLGQQFGSQLPSSYTMEDYYRIKSQNEVNRLLRLPTVDLPVISQADATKYTEWQKNNFYRQALGLPSLPPPRLFYNSPSLTAPTQQQTQHQSLYPSNNPSNNAIPSSQNSCTSLSAYTQCIQRHVATSSGGRSRLNDISSVLNFISTHYSKCKTAFGIHQSRLQRLPCQTTSPQGKSANGANKCSSTLFNNIIRPDGLMKPAVGYCDRQLNPSKATVSSRQYVNCPGTWTRWYNTHNPNISSGDFEGLWEVQLKYFFEVCAKPKKLEVSLTDGRHYQHGRDIITYNPNIGIGCVNQLQPDGICNDYRIRFCC